MKGKERISILFGVFIFLFSCLSFLILDNNFLGFTSLIVLMVSIPIWIIFLQSSSVSEAIFKGSRGVVFKNRFSNKLTGNKKLDNLTEITSKPLYATSAVFPFDLFPDKILLEQKQVILVYKHFFYSSQEFNILIEDILSPVVETSVMFATFKIELGPGGFEQNPPPIQYLRKKSAIKLKRMIMGLIMCNKEGVDLSKMTRQEILVKIEEIGSFRE